MIKRPWPLLLTLHLAATGAYAQTSQPLPPPEEPPPASQETPSEPKDKDKKDKDKGKDKDKNNDNGKDKDNGDDKDKGTGNDNGGAWLKYKADRGVTFSPSESVELRLDAYGQIEATNDPEIQAGVGSAVIPRRLRAAVRGDVTDYFRFKLG